jgi:hypothetical protein
MRVLLRPAGAEDDSQDVLLAQGQPRGDLTSPLGPADASTTVNIAVVETPTIRANNVLLSSYGNRSGSYSFRAAREFDSLGDAGRFLQTHGMELPAEGMLIIDYEDGGDIVVLHSAVVRSVGPFEQRGVTINTSYNFAYASAELVPDLASVHASPKLHPFYKPPAETDEWGAPFEPEIPGEPEPPEEPEPE